MFETLKPVHGSCCCGEISYEATGEAVLVELCHCKTCRRAAGAPLMAWAAFSRDAFRILSGEPVSFESSPGLDRTFCGRCGTSLTLADQRFADEIYVSVGSLEDAEVLPPEFHIWRSHRLSWLDTTDHLPRYVKFKVDGIVESIDS